MPLGYKLKRLVDGVRALRLSRRLRSHDEWTREQLESHQRRELAELERHAAAGSAFWRDRLGDGPPPVLDKVTLMARFDEAVTDSRLRSARLEEHVAQLQGDELLDGEFRVMVTSGTTGFRGVFAYSRAEWATKVANAVRVSSWAGLESLPRRRIAFVSTTSPLHISARYSMSFDIGFHTMRRFDIRSPLSETVAGLGELQPDQLAGYPSALALLADEQTAGRLAIHPRVVQTSSEIRTEGMEAAIREAWPNARLQNLYAITETGIVAADCEHLAGLHLLEDLAIFENLDEHGDPVPEGEVGTRILVTDLSGLAQPKLRYEISDCVSITSEPCPCGRPYRRLTSLVGRSDDILDLPAAAGGTVPVHPLALRSPMASRADVAQYQVIHDRDGLHVRVVPRHGADRSAVEGGVRDALETSLRPLGVSVPVHLHVVDALLRDEGHGGKVKLVTSRTDRRPPAPR